MPMISKSLALSLGTTSIISVLLFLYFRNKISSVEHKVSMLFKLIEDHHAQQQVQFHPRPVQNMHTEQNLINVSDDEDDDEEEEYSSDDESDRLSIREDCVSKIKTIEINSNHHEEALGEELDNITPLGDVTEVSVTKIEKNPLEETNNSVVYNNLMQGISKNKSEKDFKTLKIKELKKICATRGLNKYSHLNKAGLVELLQSSE